jgi:hypothetical protein
VDDLKPFDAAVLGQAVRNASEVRPSEVGEVRGVLVSDVLAVQMATTWVDAALLLVTDNRSARPPEGTGRVPAQSDVLGGFGACHYSVGQAEALNAERSFGDGGT